MVKVRVGSLTVGSLFMTPLTRRRGRVLEVGMLPGGGVPVVLEALRRSDAVRPRDLHPEIVVEVLPEAA